MTERLKYMRLTESQYSPVSEPEYEFTAQLDGGGCGFAIRKHQDARQLIGRLRLLADNLEKGLQERAGLPWSDAPVREVASERLLSEQEAELTETARHDPTVYAHLLGYRRGSFCSLGDMLISLAVQLAREKQAIFESATRALQTAPPRYK